MEKVYILIFMAGKPFKFNEIFQSMLHFFYAVLLMLTTSHHKTFILWRQKLIFSADKLLEIMASSEHHR